MPVGFYWDLLLLVPCLAVYAGLNGRAQNWLLLALSLLLMATWNVAFPLLLIGTTAVSYCITRRMAWEPASSGEAGRPHTSQSDSQRRKWLWLGVGFDVAVLAFFRYSTTLAGALAGAARALGHPLHVTSSVLIPVGLSFYTLARLTHTFDVYYRFERPAASFLELLTFTSFFPLTVSGPIERSSRLLPVLARRREVTLTGLYEGGWLILLGLFQKVVIADHAGSLVTQLEGDARGALCTTLSVLAYAVQIFADFSGYSEIARGIARLFGIEVMSNFRAPYFSSNLSEYWKRWHISLSSWLDDYIYKPASMRWRDYGSVGVVAAIFATFLVSALWHGNGATFLVWGAIHATGLTIFTLSRSLRKKLKTKLSPRVGRIGGTLLTFATVCLGYVFFRAPSLSSAFHTLRELVHFSSALPSGDDGLEFALLLGAMVGLHQLQLREGVGWIFARPVWQRALCYGAMLLLIVDVPGDAQRFIYFQF